MGAKSIEDIVRNYISQGKVPVDEFLVVLEEIRRTLGAGRGKFNKIYQLVAVDTETDGVDDCVVRYYHIGIDPVPLGIYEGAVRTLRHAYKIAGRGPISLRVRNMNAIIDSVKKGEQTTIAAPAEKPAETRQPEDETQGKGSGITRQQPKKKPKQKPKQRQESGKRYNINELVDALISAGAYRTIQDIEDDLTGRGLCKHEGTVERAYHEGCVEQLYTSIKGLAQLHNCLTKPKKTRYTNGTIPPYALEGMLLRAMELYGQNDQKDSEKIMTVEEQMWGQGLCEEGELIPAYRLARRGNDCSSQIFDNLVQMLIGEPRTNKQMERLRTVKEYDPSKDYEVGQLLDLPSTAGVVIEKLDADMIRVYADPRTTKKSIMNPMTLRVNVKFDKFRKNRTNYDGL
ncbi:hypothetical protein KY363_01275 [Candidatus Woesearchaeota archaeon]|nr:hypothetical protein [Candidatus Woesearchaeota archaeon]